MAKKFATDTAHRVSDEAMSMLGGYAMLGSHPIERVSRDLRAHYFVGGTNDMMVLAVFKEMDKASGAQWP